MTWRLMLVLVAVFTLMMLMTACLPDDASPDEINPVTPVDTTGNGDDDDDDDDPEPTGPWYAFPTFGFSTQLPSLLNVTFPVMSDSGTGIPDLTLDDFRILEDGIEVPAAEAPRYLRRKSDIPYTIYTVLCIDNSLSVEGDLTAVKEAANTLLDARDPDQYVAIATFSEEVVALQEFTTDDAALRAAVDAIQPRIGGTNLYGAVYGSLQKWEDIYAVTGIEQGFLVVLTDGVDTVGKRTLLDVQTIRGGKRVYTVGVGAGVDQTALEAIGNSGYYHVDDLSGLVNRFDRIQRRILEYSNSFYWITYQSPKRGSAIYHNLEIQVDGNANTGGNAVLEIDTVNASDFFLLDPGVYLNVSLPLDSTGVDSVVAFSTQQLEFVAVSSWATEIPDYSWTSDDDALFNIVVDPDFPNQCAVTFSSGGEGRIILNDNANGYATEVFIEVQGSGPIVQGDYCDPRELGIWRSTRPLQHQ